MNAGNFTMSPVVRDPVPSGTSPKVSSRHWLQLFFQQWWEGMSVDEQGFAQLSVLGEKCVHPDSIRHVLL
jgi:hypothetical protein